MLHLAVHPDLLAESFNLSQVVGIILATIVDVNVALDLTNLFEHPLHLGIKLDEFELAPLQAGENATTEIRIRLMI